MLGMSEGAERRNWNVDFGGSRVVLTEWNGADWGCRDGEEVMEMADRGNVSALVELGRRHMTPTCPSCLPWGYDISAGRRVLAKAATMNDPNGMFLLAFDLDIGKRPNELAMQLFYRSSLYRNIGSMIRMMQISGGGGQVSLSRQLYDLGHAKGCRTMMNFFHFGRYTLSDRAEATILLGYLARMSEHE